MYDKLIEENLELRARIIDLERFVRNHMTLKVVFNNGEISNVDEKLWENCFGKLEEDEMDSEEENEEEL